MVTSKILAELDLFKDVSTDVLDEITSFCRQETFKEGATIFSTGQQADHIYLLLEGAVRLVMYPSPFPEPMTVSMLKNRGQAFGWSVITDSGHYTATALAVTAGSVIAIDGEPFMEYLAQHPDVGFVVTRRIAQVVIQRLGIIRRLLLDTVRDCDSPGSAVKEN